MKFLWFICEVFGVPGHVSVRWFLLDFGLDIISLNKNKLSKISVPCKGNIINVSRYKLSGMVSGLNVHHHFLWHR